MGQGHWEVHAGAALCVFHISFCSDGPECHPWRCDVEDIPAVGRAGAGSGDRCAEDPAICACHRAGAPHSGPYSLGCCSEAANLGDSGPRQAGAWTWHSLLPTQLCLLPLPGGSVSPPSSSKGYSHTTGPQGRDVNVPGGRGQCSLPGAMPGFLALKPRNTTHNTCGGILQAGYLVGDLTHPESSPEPTLESSSPY